jgi:hypothetical protein
MRPKRSALYALCVGVRNRRGAGVVGRRRRHVGMRDRSGSEDAGKGQPAARGRMRGKRTEAGPEALPSQFAVAGKGRVVCSGTARGLHRISVQCRVGRHGERERRQAAALTSIHRPGQWGSSGTGCAHRDDCQCYRSPAPALYHVPPQRPARRPLRAQCLSKTAACQTPRCGQCPSGCVSRCAVFGCDLRLWGAHRLSGASRRLRSRPLPCGASATAR